MTTAVCDPRVEVDARGPRFGAVITVVVLALALVFLNTWVGLVLLAWQAIAFGLGTFVGLRAQPYGLLYRSLVQPRIAAATEFESAAPPRFAQLVGFVFAAVGLVALLLGLPVVATIAIGLALAAAFLNAAFGLCLGCEMYLIGKRVLTRA
jgi:hypothetical protein